MARQYSDDERAAILAKSYALLARDVTDTRQVSSEPEWADEEIRQLAFERPAGDWRRHGREFDEWKAQKAAEAKMETLKQLEVRIDAKIAAATDRVFNAIAEVVATGIYEPYDKKIAELREEVETLRIRGPVSVTAAHINIAGELMLTLSNGEVLTPGVVVGREELKRARAEVEPIDVPNVLRRVR